MSHAVRPSTPEDAAAIVALLEQVGLEPSRAPAELHWKYWQARADCAEPRSWVLVNGREVIAHAAALYNHCVWDGGQLRLIHMIDWAARPGEVGAGTALMKFIGRQTQALLAIGGSADTLSILPHMGFRIVGQSTGYVRTLFPVRFLRGVENPTWRLIPRFARNVAWTLGAPEPRTSKWRARRLDVADLDALAPVLPAPTGTAALLERSLAQLREMLNCPIVRTTLYGVASARGLGGYFLLASAPGQVRIADCWMRSPDATDWREMVLCAVSEARRDPQAAEVVIWASDPVLTEVLPTCGFHARSTVPVQLKIARGSAMPPLPLRVQMVDTDAVWINAHRRVYAA